jgi:hypothetical protein
MPDSSFTICGRLFHEKEIKWIRGLISQEPTITRAALSRKVCDQLSWFRPDGRRKDMSCRVALIRLEKKGLLQLPKPTKKIHRKVIHQQASVFDETPIIKSAGQMSHLKLMLVNSSTPKRSKLWNELIDRYHYLGYRPLVGAQLRYLIGSADGWLGAIGFSAAAWKVAPRDGYIGWTPQARQANLPYVVCNSRFLILPWIKSKNLASKILSLCAKQISQDWVDQYRLRPVLLETYVEKERFLGTCYKAANWHYVGETQGRGKLDRHHQQGVPIKDIYLYPLLKNFREILCQQRGESEC